MEREFEKDLPEVAGGEANGSPKFFCGVCKSNALPEELGEALAPALIGESAPSSPQATFLDFAAIGVVAVVLATLGWRGAALVKVFFHAWEMDGTIRQEVIGKNTNGPPGILAKKAHHGDLRVSLDIGKTLVIPMAMQALALFVIEGTWRKFIGSWITGSANLHPPIQSSLSTSSFYIVAGSPKPSLTLIYTRSHEAFRHGTPQRFRRPLRRIARRA